MLKTFKKLIILMVLISKIFVSSSTNITNLNSSLLTDDVAFNNVEKLLQDHEQNLILEETVEKARLEKEILNKESNIHKLNIYIFFNIISYLTLFDIENCLFFLSKQTKTFCEKYLNSSTYCMPFEKRMHLINKTSMKYGYVELLSTSKSSTATESILMHKNIRQVIMYNDSGENYRFTVYLNGVFTIEYYFSDVVTQHVILLNDELNVELQNANLLTDPLAVGFDISARIFENFKLFTQDGLNLNIELSFGKILIKRWVYEKFVFLKNFNGHVCLTNDGKLRMFFYLKTENGFFILKCTNLFKENVKQIKSKHFQHSLDELDLEFFN
jgi:hypothetical protein